MKGQKCQEEYIRRINKVQDHIAKHLDKPLSIKELADVAGFSKYHFSRIFQSILHESIAHYVQRIRMEQAAFLLVHRKDKNMTDIAYELGILDSTVFSRTFKHWYGISPRAYRKAYSKNCKEYFLVSKYNKCAAEKEWEEEPLSVTGQVTYVNIEEKQAIYVRHTGTYETLAKEYTGLLENLLNYAKEHELLQEGKNWLLAMYYDNPEFGEEIQFRTSICLTVPANITIQENDIVGKLTLEGGLYAVGHFEIQQNQYRDAWKYMYQKWISCSGYVPRNSYPFEVYRNNPYTDAEHIHKVDIYVPIETIHY